jgi:uncharacterized membrane protein
MADLHGERTVEIDAPRERCYAIAADLERAPGWQRSLVSVAVVERDAEGRPLVVDTESDASVRTVRSRMRFRYDPPGGIAWSQDRGELKALDGSWAFADLGGGRTRATYALRVDPGRLLGMLLRGPAEERVRHALVDRTAEELKARAEGSA